MADNNQTNVVVNLQPESPNFLKDKIQLHKLLKDLNRASKEALETLIKLMESSQDERIKAMAAKEILGFHISVAKEVNADMLQRMIAEAKLGNGAKKLVQIDGPGDSEDLKPVRPRVDFSTIREIN